MSAKSRTNPTRTLRNTLNGKPLSTIKELDDESANIFTTKQPKKLSTGGFIHRWDM